MNKIVATKPKEYLTSQTQQMRIIEGKENILMGYSVYLQDESKLSAGEIQYIAFPNSEIQIVEFLKFACDKKMPVTISNGRTGVVGGAVPKEGALMSLEQMNSILAIKKCNCRDKIASSETSSQQECYWHVVAEPGVVLGELRKKVEMKDFCELKNAPQEFINSKEAYFYPVDVTETTARLGGTVSTNASGERSFRYGPTRNWVRRLRVVLSNGEVLDIPRGEIFADDSGNFVIVFTDGTKQTIKIPTYKMPQVKNAAGYYTKPNMDLIDLFIGSEGTLGVITEIEVGITKKSENVMSLLAFFPSESDAINFFLQAKKQLKSAIVFEYFDSGALDILNKKRIRDGASSVVPVLPENCSAGIFFEVEFSEGNFDSISSEIEKLLTSNNSSIENTWGGFESK
ncbi:MAG: FAD-binding oxidoreductase, partial [Elusimicrobiota bacterium]|nr:FAD-binding oxidoreductase [Elusimicrobiota bacterium]